MERFINEMVEDLQLMIAKRLVPQVEMIARSATEDPVNIDAEGDDLERVVEQIEAQFLGKYSREFIRTNMNTLFRDLQLEVDNDLINETGFKELNITPTVAQREAIEESVRSGVGKIESLQGDIFRSVRQEISTALFQGLNSGERWETIAKRLTSITSGGSEKPTPLEKASNRAKFIARNEVGSALGKITEEAQTSAGVELYIWQTAEDERVRRSHASLNGKIWSWSGTVEVDGETYITAATPNFDPVIPGQDYNCRCVAIPYIPEISQGEGEAGTSSDISSVE